MTEDSKHQLGRFTLMNDLVRLQPVDFLPVFAKVVVIDTRYGERPWSTEYFAWSPLFDAIDQGEIPPVYVFTVDSVAGTVTAERVERQCQ